MKGNDRSMKKELSALDIFVLDFVSVLDKLKIKYVIISGYVSILFGRSRSSEDIDVIIEKLNYDDFSRLWKELLHDFECIITADPKNAYDEYLMTKHAIRFSKKGIFMPNMEICFPRTGLAEWVLGHKEGMKLNNAEIFISPIELQVTYKIFLGSDKDIEDARYLYRLFKDSMDIGLMEEFAGKLKINHRIKKYL